MHNDNTLNKANIKQDKYQTLTTINEYILLKHLGDTV